MITAIITAVIVGVIVPSAKVHVKTAAHSASAVRPIKKRESFGLHPLPDCTFETDGL